MIRRHVKKKQREEKLPEGEVLYDKQPSGVGVHSAKGYAEHVTGKVLEELVFGGSLSFSRRSRDRVEIAEDEEEESDDTETPSKYDTTDLQKQSAWLDEDDETINVDVTSKHWLKKLQHSVEERSIDGTTLQSRLRSQFEKLSRQPEWAKPQPSKKKRNASSSDDDSSDEDVLLRRAGPVLDTVRPTALPTGFLAVKRLVDPNRGCRPNAVIQSLEFHPSAHVMLTAGYHKTLDLFQVDGEANPKLHSLHVEHFPISMARFTADGNEVVMTGHSKKAFHVFNIPSGKVTKVPGIRGRAEKFYSNFRISPDNKFLAFLGSDGYILLVSNKTKQWVADLKMNGTVSDIAFTGDSQHMISFGSDGEAYVWDLSSRRCVHKFTDDGCISGTTIAASPNSKFFACGCSSGVVSVYDQSCLRVARPTPVKSLMHLTTTVDQLKFNPTSEILTIASQRKKSALRMVHLPSLTVFPNWPTSRSPISYSHIVDFSADSRFIGVGNDKGRALLYRLNHYHSSS